MSDEPRDGAKDAARGSTPWERAQRAERDAPEPTTVEDLLARLGTSDAGPRRRRRADKAPAADSSRVAAGDLIAALQAGQNSTGEPVETPDAADAPTVLRPAPQVPAPPVTPPPAPPAPTVSGPSTPPVSGPPVPFDSGPPTSVILPPVAAPSFDSPLSGQPQSGQPLSDQPLSDLPQFEVPRFDVPTPRTPAGEPGWAPESAAATAQLAALDESEDALTIRESLQRQAISPTATDEHVPPTMGTHGDARPDDPTHHRYRGFLYAGRTAIAAVTAVVLALTGYNWNTLREAEAGIQERAIVGGLNTTDPNIATPTRKPAAPAPGAPAKVYPAENILLIGSDTRAGANGDDTNGGDSITTAQSDTMMIAHISGDRERVTVVSIPRDLWVDAPQCNTWDYEAGVSTKVPWAINDGEQWRITNAYSVGGPACLVSAVQGLTGIKIDRIIGIDFQGFKSMVDAVNGITVNVCRPIIDKELGVVVPEAGVQTIFGEQALSLVRARKVQGDSESDLARIKRQQVVLSTLLRQVTSKGTISNPGKLKAFLQAFVNSTYTENVTVDSMLELAKSFGNLDPSRVTFYPLPTVPADVEGLNLAPQAEAVFDALINDLPLPGQEAAPKPATSAPAKPKATPTKPAATPTIAPPAITVAPAEVDLEVVNVAGRAGVAGEAQELLNALGYDIADDDLTLPTDGQVWDDITVLFDPDNKAAALTVAASVPGAVLEPRADLGDRVRLLLGTSFANEVRPVAVGDALPSTLVETAGSSSPPTTSAPAAGAPADNTAATPAPSATKTLTTKDVDPLNAANATCA